MQEAKILVNSSFIKGNIDDRIYGSFVEHMGRVVYSGIYEPEHPLADEDGFRKDVLEAVRKLGVTNIRYPGGNFVSCYHWEDGIGPKEKRPKRLELAWKSIETNQFGTNEFMKWAKKAKVIPMLAVNLGTNGLKEALNYLEYCNFPQGTKYSDLRIDHGILEPYKVKTWCLGNEMDGTWQLGHKTAKEYGRIASETAKAMKIVDPDIELVSCGSSLNTMDTFPEWEATTLENTYDYVDYISLHQYFEGHELEIEEFLAQSDKMDDFIKTVIAVCDYIKAKKRSNKILNISFDEWGVWTHQSENTIYECNQHNWEETPAISEMIYSFQDALLFAGMLLALLKNADRVKIACQSLLTNVSAMIMTEKGGEMWLQPNYYPFAHAAAYAHGKVMDSRLKCESYKVEEKSIPYIDHVVVYNKSEIVVLVINRSQKEKIVLGVELEGFHIEGIIEHIVMESENIMATNQENHSNIIPHVGGESNFKQNEVFAKLNPLSWNVIRIKVS